MGKFYITTPIYYINDKPHIGHAYTTLAGDVLARWHRLTGDDTFYLTGTDEHGQKIMEAADASGQDVQAFCDEVSLKYRQAWDKLNIDYDYFIRTTDKSHVERVKQIFTKLKQAKTPKDNEVIYSGEYKGKYCTGCEKFLTEKDLVGGKCPDHNREPEDLVEKNYFFRLSDYLDIIKEKIEKDEFLILPEKRKAEVLGFIKEGIPDFSVSRESVEWGIELPFDKTQKSYVWVDALANYITALGYPDDPVNFEKFWPADVHLMAQEIIKFHSLYWPAMLLALDLPLPKTEFIHGFFTINGQKMSKTLGNVISPDNLVDKFGVDGARYLVLSQFTFGSEADVQAERFEEFYNAALANGLGNLVSRVTNLIDKSGLEIKIDKKIDQEMIGKTKKSMDNFRFDEVLRLLWKKIGEADILINEKEPWKLMKDIDGNKDILFDLFTDLAGRIYNIGYFLQVFMPDTGEKVVEIVTAKKIKKIDPLFPRL